MIDELLRRRGLIVVGKGVVGRTSVHDDDRPVRVSLFVPGFGRLYVAVRAQGREPASIWEFRPAP